MKYFTNGSVDDPSGSGLTLAVFQTNSDGVVEKGTNLGYLAKEITEEEYLVWQGRILNPDNKKYFNGAFPGVGVVDKKTHEANEAKVAKRDTAHLAKQVASQELGFLRAQRDAKYFGKDHETVFAMDNPGVGEDVKAILFAKSRASKIAPEWGNQADPNTGLK